MIELHRRRDSDDEMHAASPAGADHCVAANAHAPTFVTNCDFRAFASWPFTTPASKLHKSIQIRPAR